MMVRDSPSDPPGLLAASGAGGAPSVLEVMSEDWLEAIPYFVMRMLQIFRKFLRL